MSETILQVNKYKKNHKAGRKGLFGEKEYVKSVDGVSFTLHRGETLAIVGESGCGKSTTVKSLIRVTEPTSGEVILKGQDFLKLKAEELKKARRNIKMIFQDPYASLDPRMTVGRAVGEPLRLFTKLSSREIDREVAELLERVGLKADMANRYPFEFSGGQRQRISIARALALKPRLIVADESVAALDVSIRAQIANLLMRLQGELGLSYLFISHDMGVVERISHRVAVMRAGRIVETGSRRDVFERPRHEYTKRLLAAVPVADPSRRNEKRDAGAHEVVTPLRPVGSRPNVPPMVEVEPGHWVSPAA